MPTGQTARDVITTSLRLINAIATGETPAADELNDGLNTLNDLLEIWSLQGLAVHGAPDITFNTVPNQAAYTIGPTGNIVADRPVDIAQFPYCRVGGVDFPITVIGQQEYDLISLKTDDSDVVERLLYVNEFPNGRIVLWPVPTGAIPITFNGGRLLTQAANLSQPMSFPPGYLLAFKYALAVMVAPEYEISAPDDVKAIAISSLASIKKRNKKKQTARTDSALCDGQPVTWQRGY